MERIKVTEALAFLKESSANPEFEKALLKYKTEVSGYLDFQSIELARKQWLAGENGSVGARFANHLMNILNQMVPVQASSNSVLFVSDVIDFIRQNRTRFTSAQRTSYVVALRAYRREVKDTLDIDNLDWGTSNVAEKTRDIYSKRILRAVKYMQNHIRLAPMAAAPPKPITIPEGGNTVGQLTLPPFDWAVLNEILNSKPRNTEERKARQDILRCKNRSIKAGTLGKLVAKTIDKKLDKDHAAYKRDVALAFCAYHMLQHKGQRFTFSELHQECANYLKHFHPEGDVFINRDHLALEVGRFLVDAFNFTGTDDYIGPGKTKALHIWWEENIEAEAEVEESLPQTKELDVKATVNGQDINEVEYITTLLQDLPGFVSCVSYEDEIFVHLKDYWVTLSSDKHDILDVRVSASKIAGRPKNMVLRFGKHWVPWSDYAGTFRVPVNQLKTEIWNRLGIETVEIKGVVEPRVLAEEEVVVVRRAPEPEEHVEAPVVVEEAIEEIAVETIPESENHTLTLDGLLAFAKAYDTSELDVEVVGATISKDLVQQIKDRIMEVKDKRRLVQDFAGTLIANLDSLVEDLEAKEKALQNLIFL